MQKKTLKRTFKLLSGNLPETLNVLEKTIVSNKGKIIARNKENIEARVGSYTMTMLLGTYIWHKFLKMELPIKIKLAVDNLNECVFVELSDRMTLLLYYDPICTTHFNDYFDKWEELLRNSAG